MTEAEWLACEDPDRMLAYLAEWFRESDRKGQLLLTGCARLAWQALRIHDSVFAASGLGERLAGRFGPRDVVSALIDPRLWSQAGPATEAALIRDLFGSPHRPPLAIEPTWQTHTVLCLAQAAYDDGDQPQGTLPVDRLSVLADALEDAGCTNADLLGHLRSPRPHVRGCWALDLVLGKG